MNNTISQYAIGELLDGRYFYIPAYQRGYRWTEKQVGDLLQDLLCFANDKKEDEYFYCLQPIIARSITDEAALQKIFGENINDDILSKGVWEIIDGQQRLTSIYLLYKYLVAKKGWSDEDLYDEEGKQLYHIYYETRKDSASFLSNLKLGEVSDTDAYKSNIDFYHMANAFRYIDEWIGTEGRMINKRYKLGESLSKVRDALFNLLNGMRDTNGGSVQVLWYQLAEANEKSSIKEFQKINTGKIRLTDAELVKGLFLQNKNFEESSKYIKQSSLAIEWEYLENTLHQNSFWYFLQKKGTNMPNRIDLIFSLIYKTAKLKELNLYFGDSNGNDDELEKELKRVLNEMDRNIMDSKRSEIFRFYYDQFEGKQGEELQQTVAEAWNDVMNLFRTLDDWFCTPNVYNYIGLLSQCGEDIARIVLYYDSMPEDSTQDEFVAYLKSRIKYYLRNLKRDEDGNIVSVYNKDKNVIYKTLLTLNVHLLNIQNEKFHSESDVYKFPFDVLDAQDWDIEHIDSFHTNALKKDAQKIEWIDTAIADLHLSEEVITALEEMKSNKEYDKAINQMKELAGEEEADENEKNGIGNLTLLDSATNRSYGNSLFCTKRRIIIDRIKQGVFVPTATQYVFAKFYDDKGTNRSKWGKEDMSAYQSYIASMLEEYLPEIKK